MTSGVARSAVAALLACVALTGMATGQITSYETPGNLKPTHDLACIGMDEIKSEYTPADLMVAHVKCRHEGQFDRAVVLLLVAGTYARFDTLRVPDITAHDAFVVIEQNTPPDKKEGEALREAFTPYEPSDGPKMKAFCADIKRLGPPNYYPAYMVRHGMGAIIGAGGGLAANFDAKAAWKQSLTTWLHCDVSDL
jgi:hypothetical protein